MDTKRSITASKSGAPPGAAKMTSHSLMYISFIWNGSNGD